jgi:hypothetical protein
MNGSCAPGMRWQTNARPGCRVVRGNGRGLERLWAKTEDDAPPTFPELAPFLWNLVEIPVPVPKQHLTLVLPLVLRLGGAARLFVVRGRRAGVDRSSQRHRPPTCAAWPSSSAASGTGAHYNKSAPGGARARVAAGPSAPNV